MPPLQDAEKTKEEKPIFRLVDHTQDWAFMWCQTEEEAEEFCEYLHEKGRKWNNGEKYIHNTYYLASSTHDCGVVYYFNQGVWSNLLPGFSQLDGITGIRYSDIILESATEFEPNPEFEAFLKEFEDNIVD